jgi:hypothetical protein
MTPDVITCAGDDFGAQRQAKVIVAAEVQQLTPIGAAAAWRHMIEDTRFAAKIPQLGIAKILSE